MKILLTGLGIVLAIFSILSGIVSLIWLAILGEWGAIAIGFFLEITAPAFLLPIPMMPGLFLLALASESFVSGNKKKGYFWGALSSLYRILITTLWCFAILIIFTKTATDHSFIPRLLWSACVALIPWIYILEKDKNIYSEIQMVTLEVAYLVLVIMVYLQAEIIHSFLAFVLILVIGNIVTTIMAYKIDKYQRI